MGCSGGGHRLDVIRRCCRERIGKGGKRRYKSTGKSNCSKSEAEHVNFPGERK